MVQCLQVAVADSWFTNLGRQMIATNKSRLSDPVCERKRKLVMALLTT